jgi:hypothetical protein
MVAEGGEQTDHAVRHFLADLGDGLVFRHHGSRYAVDSACGAFDESLLAGKAQILAGYFQGVQISWAKQAAALGQAGDLFGLWVHEGILRNIVTFVQVPLFCKEHGGLRTAIQARTATDFNLVYSSGSQPGGRPKKRRKSSLKKCTPIRTLKIEKHGYHDKIGV